MLVPLYASYVSATGTVVPVLRVESTPVSKGILPPGALISTDEPKFEYAAFLPSAPVAATVITPEQLPGVKLLASTLKFPAATTTTEPALTMLLIALWVVVPHAPGPPRLRLSTLAGFGLAG